MFAQTPAPGPPRSRDERAETQQPSCNRGCFALCLGRRPPARWGGRGVSMEKPPERLSLPAGWAPRWCRAPWPLGPGQADGLGSKREHIAQRFALAGGAHSQASSCSLLHV